MILKSGALIGIAFLTAASGPRAFKPGLWTQYATPGIATINGQKREGLPIDPPSPEQMCITSGAASSPAIWMAGKMGSDCLLTSTNLSNGHVSIRARCSNPESDEPPGRLIMTGRWSPTYFTVDFSTQVGADDRIFGFSGHVTGRRLGLCSAKHGISAPRSVPDFDMPYDIETGKNCLPTPRER